MGEFGGNSRADQPKTIGFLTPADWEQVRSEAFGSPRLMPLFDQVLLGQDRQGCRELLTLVTQKLTCPQNWDRLKADTLQILKQIDSDLAPHSSFWGKLAQVVSQTFPEQDLAHVNDQLAGHLHRLRYLFSSQQIYWIRQHYGGKGVCDRQALVNYLATADQRNTIFEWLNLDTYDYELTYYLTESARLHNKRGHLLNQATARPFCPGGEETVNLKILINGHSEFILSSQGNFVEVLDGTVQGAINGASFNYAARSGRRHGELDIAPVVAHDPGWRKRLLKSQTVHYRSPNRSRLPWSSAWQTSFFNPKGDYACQGRACASLIRQLAKSLDDDIKSKREAIKSKRTPNNKR